jgi:hypothetical protein
MSPPFLESKCKASKKPSEAGYKLCLAYPSTSKMEAIYSSEMSIYLCRNGRCYNPRDVATCFALVSFLAYSLSPEIEATGISETSVDFERTTRRYIPEDRTLQQQLCP